MKQQADTTREELIKTLATNIQPSSGLIPDGIEQRELKDFVRKRLLELYNIDLWGNAPLTTVLKVHYKNAFEKFKTEFDRNDELLEDLRILFHEHLKNSQEGDFYHKEVRSKKIDKYLNIIGDPFKGINQPNRKWGPEMIRRIGVLIGVRFDTLIKLANSPINVTNRNTQANAILSSRPMFMTKNRERQLEDFKVKLQEEKVLLVAGERGSGKTLFVNVFIQKHHSDYNHIIYVTVKAGQIIEGFVKSVGDYFRVSFQADESLSQQLKVALMQVKNQNLLGCLLCIDNANNPTALETFLKEWRRYDFLKDIHLVITTYCKTDIASNFSLESLKETDAKEIFDQHVKNQAKKALSAAAMKLFSDLEYIPILVEQVSLLLENNQRITNICGLGDLLKKTAQQPMIATPDVSDKFYNGEELKVIGFIKIFFSEMAERLTDAERLVLQYFSLLPAKPYSETELLDILPITADELDTLDAFVRKGWLLKKQNGFYCHELYQIAIRKIFKSDLSDFVPLLAKLVEKIRLEDISNMDREIVDVLTYVPVVEAVVSNLNFQRESISFEDNDLKHKLSVFETKHSPSENDHLVLATLLEGLGRAYDLSSNRDVALQCLYDSVCMRLRLNQENTWEFGDNLRRLANVVKLENIKEALKIIHENAKKVLINNLDTPIFVWIRFYTSLGNIYREMDDLEKAEEQLNIGLGLCGNDSKYLFDKATILDNLGFVYNTKGRKAAAEHPGSVLAKEYSESSITVREEALSLRKKIHKSPDNLEVAILYNNIGAVYSILENMQQSINAYEKCINIRENLNLPKVHNSFAIVKNNLAIGYAKKVHFNQCNQDEKDYLLNKANAFYEGAMEIRKQILKEGDTKFSHNLYSKTWILMEQGKLKNDINLLNEAFESAKAAIVFKNKSKVPVQHEIQEVEDLMKKIKMEINKYEGEQK